MNETIFFDILNLSNFLMLKSDSLNRVLFSKTVADSILQMK